MTRPEGPHPITLSCAIALTIGLSVLLGYNYAISTLKPRVVEKQVGVLNGTVTDIPVEFDGETYKCDLELHGNLEVQRARGLIPTQNRAVCESVEPQDYPFER